MEKHPFAFHPGAPLGEHPLHRQQHTQGRQGVGEEVKKGRKDSQPQIEQPAPGFFVGFQQQHPGGKGQQQQVNIRKLKAQRRGNRVQAQQGRPHGDGQPKAPPFPAQGQHHAGKDQLHHHIEQPDVRWGEKQQQWLQQQQIPMPVPGIGHLPEALLLLGIPAQGIHRHHIPRGILRPGIHQGIVQGCAGALIDGIGEHQAVRKAVQLRTVVVGCPLIPVPFRKDIGQTDLHIVPHPGGGQGIYRGHQQNTCQNGPQDAGCRKPGPGKDRGFLHGIAP